MDLLGDAYYRASLSHTQRAKLDKADRKQAAFLMAFMIAATSTMWGAMIWNSWNSNASHESIGIEGQCSQEQVTRVYCNPK